MLCYLFRRPVLYLFGAGDASYLYADAYLKIYLWGTPFTMLATGLNGFINAQGFPRRGMMTVINSTREILALPVSGISSGAQPVLGYNYGAKAYARVRQGIRFTAVLGILYTLLAWLLVILSPHLLLSVFTEDTAMIEAGMGAMRLYFFGFFFMAFQFTGQSAFTGLGDSCHAIFFSLLRKAVIVAPLTVLLPKFGLGVDGVFLAEPVSNAIGGLACFATMYVMLYRKLGCGKV